MRRTSITVGIVVLIMSFFLMVNAEFLFPGQGSSIQLVMLIYLVMALAAFSYTLIAGTKKTTRLDNFLAGDFTTLGGFAAGFVATYFIAGSFIPASVLAGFDVLQVLGIASFSLIFIIIYVFVKAYIEEVFFRVFLEEFTGRWVSVILFGFFHLAVLSIGQPPLLSLLTATVFLMTLGTMWSYMKSYPQFGFMMAVGSHVAWNLHVVGII